MADSHIIIFKTIDSNERGMNPVSMTIINPGKELWPHQRFKSATSYSQVLYPTKPWGLSRKTWCILVINPHPIKTKLLTTAQIDSISEMSINPFPNKPWFLRVCSTSLLKTLWEKEKLLVTSNFSFSHSVFYPFEELSAIFIKLWIVVCKHFQFRRVQNLSFGKGLTENNSYHTILALKLFDRWNLLSPRPVISPKIGGA